MSKKKEAGIKNVRIIGVFAHVDAGKTTTSEAILYYTGRIHRQGNIDEGNTQLDWMQQERERGITIMSAATACHWRGHRVNLIDTPGHIDFTAEVMRSIRVIDGAVIVVCGVGGVEPQTESVWMHTDREKLARVIFVNKLDRLGADFERAVSEVRERLTPNAIPLQLPVGQEGDFTGVVDLLNQQALIWHDGADDPVVEPVPTSMQEPVTAAREALLDAICETDDDLLGQRLEGIEPDLAVLQAALRQATVTGQLVPILCGASRRRAAVARRHRGLSACAGRHGAHTRHRPGQRRGGRRTTGRSLRAPVRIRLQDRYRPARGTPDLGARLLRASEGWRGGL